MNMIKSLLFKQLGLALLHVAVLFALLVVGFGNYLEQTQQEKAKVLQQFVTNSVVNDPKLLARQLRNAYDFQSINIALLDGTSVYQFKSPSNPSAIGYSLLGNSSALGKHREVSQPTLNIKVSYQLRAANELALFDTLMALVIIIPLIFSVLQMMLVKRGVQQCFLRVSQQLADNVEMVVKKLRNKRKPAPNWALLPPWFADVGKAIQHLSSFVDKQLNEMETSTALIKTEAFSDDLTGLPNRNRFVEFFEQLLGNEDSLKFGVLSIIRCTELQQLNQTRGYQEGDKYIKAVAENLQKAAGSYDKAQLYRLNGSDFACVLPSMTIKQAEDFGQALQDNFNRYQNANEIDSVAYTGIVGYQPGQPLGELLALADTAISIAQTRHANAWHIQSDTNILEDGSAAYGNQNWRQVIDDVIENQRITLMHQLIQPGSRSTKTYSEVLARFKTIDDQILPTASFLAMAEKLDKIVMIDRMIVDSTIDQIKKQSLVDQCFGLNITPRTVHDEQFMIWLERRLLKDSQIAARLIFEVSEFGLQQNIKASKRFIDMIHRTGARITVERFGVGLTSFKFFRDLKPDFIKMDGAYTRDIHEDKNNQYFMRLMVDLAHRIGVSVLAEGVETQQEKHILEKLLIDGVQGYYIGKPVGF